METFPLTPNGKLDRKALPPPSYESPKVAHDFVRAYTETEKALAAIWTEVLKVEQIGLDDNFFDLGGHSLLAIKTVSRIRDVFEMDLPTQTLFEKPILADLAKVLTGGKGSGGTVQRIEPRTQNGPCVLSFVQERFWLLHQLAPASPVYNIVDVIRFEGTYEAEAMKRALKELVRRHEILRTVFSQSHGQPMQIILPTIGLMLSELDLSALPEQEREREWIRVVREEGRKPFDLSQAPLLRGALVHLAPQEHRLLLTFHHIIADEWSMEVLHQEVNQLYTAFSQGQSSPLSELPIQYADFACWQRDWLQGDVRRRQIAYWKEALTGAPSLLELPTDKPRPAVQSFRGATETFVLPKDLVERLKALGRQHQATLFMTLEASFAVLLHRYTGQEDILVGTPMSGRPHSETERLMGCFSNTVVLRTQFTHDLTFRSLLHQVRERALGAYAHPDLPFDHLVAELAPERDPSKTPLFQVMFTLYNTGGVSQASKVSGIRELETGTSKFDLTLSISETEDGLEGIVEYSTDLFEAETIRRLYGHYSTLLEEIARKPEQRISKIPMLAASERHQILNEWNNTVSNYPKDECLHQLFEKMAKQATSRIAVECAGRSLTYGQLNAKANRLANFLIESGVTPDSLVGIHLERSLDLIVGLLAILKAGAAYVPMDASFPSDRLAYMMNNAGISLLVTQSSLLGGLPPSGQKVICLDTEWETIQRKDSADPNVAVSPSNLAYTIYTSGSTGEPKGVMIEHGSVVNFLVSMQREPGFDETEVLVAVTTISFDIAALEIFLPLISGGRLVLASRDEVIDGSLLLQRIRSSGATTLQATPATWKLMLEAGWQKTPGLKMLCGGEALSRELANRMLERGGELWNMYGPTETTIWSAVRRIEPGLDPVLIGLPIANTQFYIVDKELEPVPIGVAGELLIGGDGLSRGYLNRPELTAQRFIENPFSGSGSRVYRTGDLARFRSDGGIEFLGRLDFQVKVRGYRIELGEIEYVLTQHAGAKDAVAMTWEDQDGDKRLVAYYIPAADWPLKARDLGKMLREKLPDYMIPSYFVEMETFPLTPNGKIDRKALPTPSVGDGSSRGVAVAPQTPTEEMVLAVFHAVLDRTDFGVFDNFFDLGGHSLMAARIMFQLRVASGCDLPLRVLFERQTVSGLAEAIDGLAWLATSRQERAADDNRVEIVL
jgi:amino acid adenylation domain-containing protein